MAARGATGYFGVYAGQVINNADPEKTGRLTLVIPAVLGYRQTPWAMPMVTPGSVVVLPEPGDSVWVMFEGGDTGSPVWTGVGMSPNLAPEQGEGGGGGSKAFTMTVMGA